MCVFFQHLLLCHAQLPCGWRPVASPVTPLRKFGSRMPPVRHLPANSSSCPLRGLISGKFHQHCTAVTSLPLSELALSPLTKSGSHAGRARAFLVHSASAWGQWLLLISALPESQQFFFLLPSLPLNTSIPFYS